ncbi:dTDP-4-dehydrorhamnose reductase [Thermodesulfobacteriota bacterium]
MKIFLLGSKGRLGSECLKVLSEDWEVVAPDRKELDIIRWDAVIEGIQVEAPDVVINCAALTDVDACEKEDPFVIRKNNVEGPRNLAQGCARFNSKFIHLSSDYIFSGKKPMPQPYFEDDPADPISAYGKSKMESEVAVRENAPNYVIVRSGWLYGLTGRDFIKSIISGALEMKKKKKPLRIVDDQFGSPTWCYRLAEQIKQLIIHDAKQTYHATAEGYCSRFEYTEYVLKKLKIKVKLEPCSTEDYPREARRPLNCLLENRLLKKQGINIMPEWKKDVDEFLNQYGKELVKQAKAAKG